MKIWSIGKMRTADPLQARPGDCGKDASEITDDFPLLEQTGHADLGYDAK